MKVLVTGGTGFIGKHLKNTKPNWHYIGSKDVNLVDAQETFSYIQNYNPDNIVHLAAVVGGISFNNEYPEKFFFENSMMNLNVISSGVKFKIQRILAALSSCAFPDVAKQYPFTENSFHDGAPAYTNLSYGYSKRLLKVHCDACRRQYGYDYSTFSPSNVYGPGDDFNPKTSHFVSAMIKKIHYAKDGDTVEFWGTGNPLRQQLYVEDLAKIIPVLLEKHHTEFPLIIAPKENLSIKEMVNVMLEIANKDVRIVFNGNLDGQFRKDGDNSKFIELCGNFDFTSFKEGLKKTYDWYIKELI